MKIHNDRYKVRGNRIDNGKIIEGFPSSINNNGEITEILVGGCSSYEKGVTKRGYCYSVDPLTVKPIAVKMDWSGFAPRCINCGRQSIEDPQSNYCPDCGIRCDWSK